MLTLFGILPGSGPPRPPQPPHPPVVPEANVLVLLGTVAVCALVWHVARRRRNRHG